MEIVDKNLYKDCCVVTLISEQGEILGEKNFSDAFLYAKEQGKDLTVVKDGEKPFLKIVDYGKYLYKQKKNQKKQKKNVVVKKEIKFGIGIGENDYIIKINHIKEFLKKGNLVCATLQLNGREIERTESAFSFMENIKNDLEGYGYTEDEIKLNGRTISIVFKGDK